MKDNETWESQYLKKVYKDAPAPGAPAAPPTRPPAPPPPAPSRFERPPKKRRSGLGVLLTSIIILAMLAAALGFVASIFSRFILFETLLTLMPGEKLLSATNILVMGLDQGTLSHRSDAMMVVHVDPARNSAYVISIPRDMIVNIPGRGLDKITHAYAFGGAELARATTENFLNIKIPYYVSIDLPGLAKLIDEIGGVTIDVEKRMYYIDHAQGLFVDLQPGVQKLSGQNALNYLRYRHDGGDINRILRQQKFIRSMASQIGTRENILKSPQIVVKLFSFMDTNLNTREILGLALNMRKIFELGSIKMAQIPGYDMMIDGVYYLKPDNAELLRIIGEFQKGS